MAEGFFVASEMNMAFAIRNIKQKFSSYRISNQFVFDSWVSVTPG